MDLKAFLYFPIKSTKKKMNPINSTYQKESNTKIKTRLDKLAKTWAIFRVNSEFNEKRLCKYSVRAMIATNPIRNNAVTII
jgi:hypothetical protein